MTKKNKILEKYNKENPNTVINNTQTQESCVQDNEDALLLFGFFNQVNVQIRNSSTIPVFNNSSTNHNFTQNSLQINASKFKSLVFNIDNLIEDYSYLVDFSSALQDLANEANKAINANISFKKKDASAIILSKKVVSTEDKNDISPEEKWNELLSKADENYLFAIKNNNDAIKLFLMARIVFAQQDKLCDYIENNEEKDKYLKYLSDFKESMADKFIDALATDGMNKELCLLVANYFYNKSLASLCSTAEHKKSTNKDNVSNKNSTKFVLQFSKLHCLTELASLNNISDQEKLDYEQQTIKYVEDKLSCSYDLQSGIKSTFFNKNPSYVLDFSYYFKYKLKNLSSKLNGFLGQEVNLDNKSKKEIREIEENAEATIDHIVSFMGLIDKHKKTIDIDSIDTAEIKNLIDVYLAYKKDLQSKVDAGVREKVDNAFGVGKKRQHDGLGVSPSKKNKQ